MKISDETKKHLESGSDLIVSVSGGKDSTASCLRLFELGYGKSDFTRIFADTGWESKETYAYLDEIEEYIGPIIRVKANIDISKCDQDIQDFILKEEALLGYESPFIRQVFKMYCWPSQFRKYCTATLKMQPITSYFNELDNDFINIIGVRREESVKRSTVAEWEWNDKNNAYTWRPLYDWTEKDVIDIHTRFGIIPNQMYLHGHSRVGCFPCIYSRKDEISRLTDERIDLIDRIEKKLGQYNFNRAFINDNKKVHDLFVKRKEISGFYFQPLFQKQLYKDHIQNVVDWSKTVRGGKQYALFDLKEPSCAKWGLCNFSGDEQ
tara:strand:- start:25 stop:990 length:966 start_codon:yes stop_codon:yes gene_type:complete